MSFKVVERFVSINGEGRKAGELAVFIRFKGCNLNCSYCDTKWANEENAPYEEMTAEEIAGYVKNTKVANVTLTGGEPLLQSEIKTLCNLLISQGNSVEIETNGSMPIFNTDKRPSFTLDYKLPSSNMEEFMCLENYSRINENDTIKFVVGSIADLEKAESVINKYRLSEKCAVYLSPVFGRIEPSDMVEYMKSKGMNKIKLQLQLHKFIWAPDKKGV